MYFATIDGPKLRALRDAYIRERHGKRLGATAADFAGRVLGVTQRHLVRLEAGTSRPSLSVLDRLARHFDTATVADLIVSEDDRAVFLTFHEGVNGNAEIPEGSAP